MMKILISILYQLKLISLLAVLFIACQSTIEQQPLAVDVPTKQGAVTVHTGMSKDSVLWTLGVPLDSYFLSPGIEVYQYSILNYGRLTMTFEEGKVKDLVKH